MEQKEAKMLAAKRAAELLPTTGVIGLGSGSTARLFIKQVGALVSSGRELVGVPTSNESREQAISLGIPLLEDRGPWSIDVCVDGADEVSRELDLIKGGGACHAREKIVNYAAQHNIIVVDESKLSQQLGERWPVPVEVLRFGAEATRTALEVLGAAELRLRQGKPVLTDSGNWIYDVTTGAISEPARIDARIRAIPGVVATGLFIGRANRVIVAGEHGVTELVPGPDGPL